MIRILIVDDSETETTILKHILEGNPDFTIIGRAKNGAEAVKLVEQLKPDLVTMDIQMPVMNGIEATRLIMSQNPTPIVIISSKLHEGAVDATFQALDAGALSVLAKPFNITSPAFAFERRRIIDTVRGMAEIKVIKRRPHVNKSTGIHSHFPSIKEKTGSYEIIAMGASIGGTQALKVILSKLPEDFPVPIVIVQHMLPGFISGFSKWLNENTKLDIHDARDNEVLKRGTVYFAPDHYHLEVQRKNGCLVNKLVQSSPVSGFCPSITVLLQSVAKSSGKHGIGILLTGMGNDGAQGLLELKKAQGHTVIQDEASSIVFGMAGVAQTLGAVDNVLKLDDIANYLIKITNPKK